MKRAFDVLVSVFLLIGLSPVLLTVAFLVRIKLGTPILFKQERPGYNGKPFFLYKFRSMTDKRDRLGQLLPDSERLTRLGQVLRNTSLDELPEVYNVLKGEMSLVGPRPLLMEYLELYSPEQARRHDVKPGITGLAQVNGRNALSWEDKFKMDVWYVDQHNFVLDIKILFLTIIKVLNHSEISQKGHVTARKFSGNKNE